MEYDTLRYDHLKDALAQCCDGGPSLCDLFLDILQTGELAARCEAQFLARFGLNSARPIILVLLNNADSGSMRSSELAGCSQSQPGDHDRLARHPREGRFAFPGARIPAIAGP